MIYTDPLTGVSFDDGTGPGGYDPALELAIARSLEGEGGTGGGVGQGQPGLVVVGDTGPGVWGTITGGLSSAAETVTAPLAGILSGIEWTGRLLPVLVLGLGAFAIYTLAPRAPGRR